MSQKRPKKCKNGRYCLYYKGKQFTGKDLDDVKKRRDQYKRQMESGLNGTVTVKAYAYQWLPDNKSHVTDIVFNEYSRLLEVLVSCIGSKQIDKVTPSDIKHIYVSNFSSCSDGYIKRVANIYTSLFDSAVEDHLCITNPCRTKTAKPPKGTADGSHRNITPEEREIIHALQHRFRPIVMTMLYAGLRNGEAIALDIDRDIDFDKDEIHVSQFARHPVDNYNDTYSSSTGKTDAAVRTIKLFPILKQELQGKHGLLVESKNGGLLTRSEWLNGWKQYCRKAEEMINGRSKFYYGRRKEDIEKKDRYEALIKQGKVKEAEQYKLPVWKTFDVRPYDLRHSFCTYCVDCGIEAHVLQTWMGHTSLKMIQKVYDHVSDQRIEKEFEKIKKLQENSTKNSTTVQTDPATQANTTDSE